MANLSQNTLSHKDMMSSKLQRIGISTDRMLNIFVKLEFRTNENCELLYYPCYLN